MKNEFVNYDQAVALKELGFDEPCFGYYDIDEGYSIGYALCFSYLDLQPKIGCSAPLKQQVFRWFRDKYDLLCYIRKVGSNYWYNIDIEDGNEFEGRFDTYEEAEDACIDKLIEIVKQK